MRSLIELASDDGCSRVEWTADAGSPGAPGLYGRPRIRLAPSKIFFYGIQSHRSGL